MRLFAGILPAITALATLVPASAAQADLTPVTDPLQSGSPNGSITLPSPVFCPFDVDIGVVSNNEYQDVTTLADGTTITKITGNLVESFKNDSTGYTIVHNISGPTTTTMHPAQPPAVNGTGTEVGRGNNMWIFGPRSQANTGEPGLVFTSGRAIFMDFELLPTGTRIATSFSLSGNQDNVCSMLAAG